ncbi:hypothetical protein V3N99_21445 [Dermatophilaceae bacterium Soc4.6]
MFTARPDGSGVRPLLAGSGGEPRQWSPDGTLLAVIATNHGPLVGSTVRADGTHQHVFRLPPGAPPSLPCGIWSPDAQRLACEGFDDAHPDRAGMYTVRASDGLQLVQVTKHRDVPCSYSPDGTRILFLRLTAEGEEHNQLMTVQVDGSHEHLITQSAVGLSCDWSPDGRTVLSEMKGSLVLFDPSGTPTPIPIATGGSAGRGAFSADGSHIIFSFKVGAQEDIYTVRTDGSDLTQITDTPANEEFGDWGR